MPCVLRFIQGPEGGPCEPIPRARILEILEPGAETRGARR